MANKKQNHDDERSQSRNLNQWPNQTNGGRDKHSSSGSSKTGSRADSDSNSPTGNASRGEAKTTPKSK